MSVKYDFYKIAIRGTSLSYIGSTTKYKRRMYDHQYSCENIHCSNHFTKLYEVIREHGGWSNVDVTLLDTQCYDTRAEALLQEQKYITKYKANLNGPSASTPSLNTLIELRDITKNDTNKNKQLRRNLNTAIWKKTHGKEKYQSWQRKYMRGKQAYKKQAQLLRHCLL